MLGKLRQLIQFFGLDWPEGLNMVKLAEEILSAVGEPLSCVEAVLRSTLSDTTPEARTVYFHLVDGGGKRIRPLVTLLAAKLFSSEVAAAIPVAAAMELIHMATLVHDDIIDRAHTRRGRPTVNHLWGNQLAVLTGDALLARALSMLVDAKDARIVKVVSCMIYNMCEGEITQNATLNDANQTEADYFDRIEKKTALFFSTCCQAGALVVGAAADAVTAIGEYGRLVGLAFQVIDDLLDFTADPKTLGKPVGSDLAAGILTLPVIHVLHHTEYGSDLKSQMAGRALGKEAMAELLEIIQANGALDYAWSVAGSLVRQAKHVLPASSDSAVRESLLTLADMVVSRSF